MGGKVVKKKPGRPTKYTKELAERICSLMAEGYVLTQIQELPDMPVRQTIAEWAVKNPDFSDMYARARELLYDWHADNLFKVEHDPNIYRLKDDFGKIDPTPLNAKKLYSDNVKWAISRLLPKKYGDKQLHELTGADGQPLSVSVTIGAKSVKS